MNKFELAADVAKAALENPAVRHALENAAGAGVKLFDAAVEHTPGANFVAKVVENCWSGSAFRKLAEEQAGLFEKAAASRIAPARGFTLPMTRIASDEPAAALHPVLSAALRGDKQFIQGSGTLRQKAEAAIGLHPNALEPTADYRDIALKLHQGPDVQSATGGNVNLFPFEHGGFTPGYIHNLEAYARIADRYGLNLEQVAAVKLPDAAGFSTNALRQIETHLKLEKGSLRYESDGLTLHDRDGKSSISEEFFPEPKARAIVEPRQSSSTKITEDFDNNVERHTFNIDGRNYPLISHNMWLAPEKWKGLGDNLTRSDWKFHVVGQSADAVKALQDRLIPSLFDDPEWKKLLYSWKSIEPNFRTANYELSGQQAKTFTLYPTSSETMARAASKLREALSGLPVKAMDGKSGIADRSVYADMPITLAQETYPMMRIGDAKAVPFNADINAAIRTDRKMGTIGNEAPITRRRLAVLEELTGIEPGTLVANDKGVVGVKVTGIPKIKQDQIYLDEGQSVRRGGEGNSHGITTGGYSGRWALNVLGGRYDLDPFAPIDISKPW